VINMSMAKKSGTITYTRRAFHQDASEAMGGDIVKGLMIALQKLPDHASPNYNLLKRSVS